MQVSKAQASRLRLCAACRQMKPREELLRLTVDSGTSEVFLNLPTVVKHPGNGRSAYLCRALSCVDRALKSNKLKGALEGGRGRKDRQQRRIKWPLESQLIHTLRCTCTDSTESCHNTGEEGSR